MTTDNVPPVHNAACRRCGGTEFDATEKYHLSCTVNPDDAGRLVCESEDGIGRWFDTLICSYCGEVAQMDDFGIAYT